MAAKLKAEDYDLLEDLYSRGGVAQILHGGPRDGAERLVAAGYATVRPLSISDLEYEITQLGRTARVLKAYGIYNTLFSSIGPHRFDVDGRWWLKVSPVGDPAVMMEIGAATKLVAQLRATDAHDLADLFERETERTRRYSLAGAPAA